MPGPLVPAIIAAGAALGSTGAQAYAQGKMNKKTRKWNEQMYDRQRGDALADYNMQNQYNSPAAQMERFAQAGLNPNLIYGNSNEGATVRSTDVKSWNPQAPEIDLSRAANSGLSAYFDAQLKSATIDNLQAQNAVIQNEAALKAGQLASIYTGIENTQANTANTRFNTSMASALAESSLQAADANVRKLNQDIDIAGEANIRARATSNMTLKTMAQTLLNLKSQGAKTDDERKLIAAQIRNLDNENVSKLMNIDLQKLGVQPGDNIGFRMLGLLMNKLGLGDILRTPRSSVSGDNK